MKARRTEIQIIKSSDWRYEVIQQMLVLANNLANTAHWTIRQHWFHMSGRQYTEDIAADNEHPYLNWMGLNRVLKDSNNRCYKSLPANVSQEVLKCIDREWTSFFNSMEMFKKGGLEECPSIPHYRKKGGTYVLVFNTSTIKNQKSFNECGSFYLPKFKVPLKIKNFKTCKQIRIVPKNNYIKIEAVYEVEVKEPKPDNIRYLSIDLGISNLCTCTSNVARAFIIDGMHVKCLNQFYNKEVARLRSELEISKQGHTSKRIQNLGLDRSNSITDYFHKSSRFIIDYCLRHDINTIVIGKNDEWKDEVNLGKKTNQNFVQIPFNSLIEKIQSKAELEGISVVLQEESYTSKVSFFDNDYIPTYGIDNEKSHPSGRRVKRGVYKTSDGFKFNADVNGSLNILRKYLTKVYADREVL